MIKVRRLKMWITLILIALWTLFSVYGAFLGSDRSEVFFNSIPLSIFWITLLIALVTGVGLFRRLLRSPGLLLIHLGIIAVLFGAMWGSEKGHRFQKNMFGIEKIRTGTIIIYKGLKERRIIKKNAHFQFTVREGNLVFFEDNEPLKNEDERIFVLPFEIKLNDFRIEYYDSPHLIVKSDDGAEFVLESVKIGKTYNLEDNISLTIVDIFKNFKLRRHNEKLEAYDQEGPGSNPAVRTLIRYPDGSKIEQFAFARYAGNMGKKSKFSMQYRIKGMVRDYFSDVQVIEKGNIIREKSIQVNDPLYYGGYHFYQSSYDTHEGSYTVLSVTSDSGLHLVFGGYLLLMVGIILHMWVMPIFRHRNKDFQEKEGWHGN